MKLSIITDKTSKELSAFIQDQQKALAEHAVEMRTKKVNNVKQTAALKKTIAQALTVKRQRELAEEFGSSASDEGASHE